MKIVRVIFLSVLCAGGSSAKDADTAEKGVAIRKPVGTYASMLTERAAANPRMQGALIRTGWADIEPSPGKFDFSSIDQKLALLPSGKNWSLTIHGGWTSLGAESGARPEPAFKMKQAFDRKPKPHMSPPWLVSEFGAETFVIHFRGTPVNLPKYWDPIVQTRLAVLMDALAKKYKNDDRLMLIYVPQMTSNGIEGHFNGVPNETLLAAAGLKPDEAKKFEHIWTDAALSAIRTTAAAFDNKAVAFEVHEVLGSAAIPRRIMDGISADPALKDQAGVGMWWISGKTDYQSDLVKAIEEFTGDVYGQVIGRSDQTNRFPNGDYGEVFKQAKKLGMLYIEPWNYEFENHTCDDLMEEFNRFCVQHFSNGSPAEK